MGKSEEPADRVIPIAGIPIHDVTLDEAVDEILAPVQHESLRQVCFVNAHCVNVAWRDDAYRERLHHAWRCYADGIGMKIAARVLARPLRDNVNGTDLFPRLCDRMAHLGTRIYLLGGEPGVTDELIRWLSSIYPSLPVAGHHHGFFGAKEESAVLEDIRQSGTEVLFVAMGVPRQDLWISQHREELPGLVALGVGGLFNFYSGRIPRAPHWMRRTGMEWVHRFWQEPARLWQRYWVGNVVFLVRVFVLWVSSRFGAASSRITP